MKYASFFLALLTLSFMSFAYSAESSVSASGAHEVSAKKKHLIDQLLTITGAAKMADLFVNVYVDQMAIVLQEEQPDINPKAFEIMREVIDKLIREEIFENKALNKVSYPVYDQYFTAEDLAELVAFYQTPVGRKTIMVLPIVTQETVQAAKAWGQTLGPKIQQRLMSQFKAEGIELH
jgi:hypothetical protein